MMTKNVHNYLHLFMQYWRQVLSYSYFIHPRRNSWKSNTFINLFLQSKKKRRKRKNEILFWILPVDRSSLFDWEL